jgi:hypothetical protein
MYVHQNYKEKQINLSILTETFSGLCETEMPKHSA